MVKTYPAESAAVKGTLLIASLLTVLASDVMSPALPAISSQFQDTPNVALLSRLVLTLPAFFIAINAPIAGYIVDRIGRKNVLLVSILLAGLAGISGYFAPTLRWILFGRGLLGIAVAGIMTATSTLIADYFTGPERSRMMGLQTGFMGIGGTLLVITVGLLTDIGWRAPFLIYLLPFAMLPFIWLILFEPSHDDLCEVNPGPAGEPGTCAGQSVHEATSANIPTQTEPILIRLIAFVYGMMIMLQIVSYIIPLQLPFYLRDLVGATGSQNGFTLSFISLSFAISAMLFGRIGARMDHISVLILGLALLGAGYSTIALAGEVLALIIIGLILAGIGLGQMIPNLYVWLANETPLRIRGRVMGGFTTALFLGQFLSPFVSQPVVAFSGVGRTILITGGLLLALTPIFFATRKRIRLFVEPALENI